MTWTPISNTVPQYEENGVAASGFYIKFYASGTTTPIPMAIDATGVTTLAKAQLNTEGYPINGSSAEFIPHIDQKYKIALFRNATDADANDLANAAWVVDALFPVVTRDSVLIKSYSTVNDFVIDTAIVSGDTIETLGYFTEGDGGNAKYYISSSTGSADGGKRIDLNNGLQAQLATDLRHPKLWGAKGDGATDDQPAINAIASSEGGFTITKGDYVIGSNQTITGDLEFLPGATITVNSGITLTINGNVLAADTQLVFQGAGNVVISSGYASVHWFDTVTKAIGAISANDTLAVYENISFAGVNITKKINIQGVGREYLEVSGALTLTDTGGGTTWNNIHLKSQVTVNGVGGMNFRDCQLNPGAGVTQFLWNHTLGAGGTPQIAELMQCKFISGRLVESLAAGVTYVFHVKETSLFTFSEANTLTAFAGSFVDLAIYDTLVNINNPAIAATSNIQLKFLDATSIDDNTTNVAWYDNNGVGFDTLIISGNVTMAFDSVGRFIEMNPQYVGSGVPAAQNSYKTLPTGSLETFDPDLYDVAFYEGSVILTVAQTWLTAAGSGQFKGQKSIIKILGSLDPNGNNVNFFGRKFNPTSQQLQGLSIELTYDGTNWVPEFSGYEEFFSTTTADLEDISNSVNTSNAKVEGYKVRNETTNLYVVAAGNTDGSVWVYEGTGNTAHTPT